MEVKDLPQITQSTESDFAVSSTSQKTRLISFKNIFEKISFSSLTTTAKNIIGAINELNAKTLKTSSIQASDSTSCTVGDLRIQSIVFTLDKTPTECYFVPVSTRWCSIETCTIGISNNVVTVTLKLDCLYTTSVMNATGYLLYR